MEWTEIIVTVRSEDTDRADAIAHMTVPYGIYIEDYSNIEQETWEIAHIDLIDEELLKKDRTKSLIHIYISPDENPAEAVAFLRERLDAEEIAHEISTNGISEEDWANNWKTYFKSIRTGEKLLIQPTWIEDEDAGDRKILRIDPGMAFGTGGHTTTKICLESLEKYIKDGDSIMDMGCGSGILSIAALLLGAGTATGVDIDATAVRTAIENGELNGFKPPEYTVSLGNLADSTDKKYDIVVANIVADIVIMFSSQATELLHDDGYFITSGIIDTREDDVLAGFEKNNFEVVERCEEKGWLCFVCKKK